jgi:hypothetical protein
MQSEMRTWHVVSNEAGTILGVYSILAMAQSVARRIERDTGLPTYLHTGVGHRPHVGGSVGCGHDGLDRDAIEGE